MTQNSYVIRQGSGKHMDIDQINAMNKIAQAEAVEEAHFIDRVYRVIKEFQNRGLSEESSVQLAIAFYNDPDIKKKRVKRSQLMHDIGG